MSRSVSTHDIAQTIRGSQARVLHMRSLWIGLRYSCVSRAPPRSVASFLTMTPHNLHSYVYTAIVSFEVGSGDRSTITKKEVR
jgi:hypothetical protein